MTRDEAMPLLKASIAQYASLKRLADKTMPAYRWCAQRTTKARGFPGGVFSRPSTAEFKRWLRDPTTPRHVKCAIYGWLNYRRTQ